MLAEAAISLSTMDSGFLDYLRAGDEVMADRGFTIRDLLDERRVSLNIPAFTYRRNQLTNEETDTHQASSQCPHTCGKSNPETEGL